MSGLSGRTSRDVERASIAEIARTAQTGTRTLEIHLTELDDASGRQRAIAAGKYHAFSMLRERTKSRRIESKAKD